MSNNISKLFKFDYDLSLDELKGKTLAIDLMPICYQFLYIGDMHSEKGPLRSKGFITSYLFKLISWITNLKSLGIEPYICLDNKKPYFKNAEINKRISSRCNTLDNYNEKIENHQMTPIDWFKYNCAKYYITEEQIVVLHELLILAGFKVFRIGDVEGQSLCAYLKKQGLVDYCFSNDKDITLYDCESLIHIDLKSKGTILFNPDKNYKLLELNNFEEFITCAIAAGLDYSNGLKKVGPINALKKLKKNKQSFFQEVKALPNYYDIADRLQLKLNESDEFAIKAICNEKHLKNKDLTQLELRLKQLQFSEKTIAVFKQNLQ